MTSTREDSNSKVQYQMGERADTYWYQPFRFLIDLDLGSSNPGAVCPGCLFETDFGSKDNILGNIVRYLNIYLRRDRKSVV